MLNLTIFPNFHLAIICTVIEYYEKAFDQNQLTLNFSPGLLHDKILEVFFWEIV